MHKFLFYNKFTIFRRPVRTRAPDGHLQSVTIPDAV